MKVKNLFVLAVFLFLHINIQGQPLTLGIFDITHNQQYRYQQFIDIATSADFDVEYVGMDKILDNDFTQENINKYDGILFLLDTNFLEKIRTRTLSTQKLLGIISQFAQRQQKLIGFAIPSIGIPPMIQTPFGAIPLPRIATLPPIFQRIGINFKVGLNQKMQAAVQLTPFYQPAIQFLQKIDEYFNTPIEARSGLYHKTLSNPSRPPKTIQPITSKQIKTLPIKPAHLSREIQATLPYGIYYFEPHKKNHIFITSYSLLSSLGISENYYFFPAKFPLRKEMYSAIHQMMWDLHNIMLKEPIASPKPRLCKSIRDIGLPIKRKIDFGPQKIAWLDIGMFEKNTEKHKTEQKRLIDSIVRVGSDLYLWVTCNPHMVLSDIGVDKEWKTQHVLDAIAKFTKQLAEKCKIKEVTPPKILLGYEIANNIRPHNKTLYKPNYTPVDIQGNIYPYCPRPLDKNFWQKDIIESTQKLLEKWENPALSNGIKISGIVLDFEFYYCRSTKAFLHHMGFNPENIEKFAHNTKWDTKIPYPNKNFLRDLEPLYPKIDEAQQLARNLNNAENKRKFINLQRTIEPTKQKIKNNLLKNIQLLEKNKKMKEYFAFLENEAVAIGHHIRTSLPHMLLGCYATNISIDWFFKGFYKGISTGQNPVLMLTFNAGFNLHKAWLEDNDIQAHHFGCLMLGKLKNLEDCKEWRLFFKKHHNGKVWFNRWSTFGQKAEHHHSNIEKTHMLDEENKQFFKMCCPKNSR